MLLVAWLISSISTMAPIWRVIHNVCALTKVGTVLKIIIFEKVNFGFVMNSMYTCMFVNKLLLKFEGAKYGDWWEEEEKKLSLVSRLP